jgi:hypothetical protein
MCPRRIDADAKDLSAQIAELLDPFSELGKFVRSTGAKVEGVRQQDDPALGQRRRQPHGFLAAHWQLKVGRWVARCERVHSGLIITRLAAPLSH